MPKTIIYSTPFCPYCIVAKNYFKKNEVEFEEINVEGDERAFNEMVEKSGQMNVPVIEIDGEVVVGFNKGRVDELLGLKK